MLSNVAFDDILGNNITLKFVMHLYGSEFFLTKMPILRLQTTENDTKYL